MLLRHRITKEKDDGIMIDDEVDLGIPPPRAHYWIGKDGIDLMAEIKIDFSDDYLKKLLV